MIHAATCCRAALKCLSADAAPSSRVHALLETAVSRFKPPTCDRRIILGVACSSQRNCASLSKLPVSCSTVLSYPVWPVPSCPCTAEATLLLNPARPFTSVALFPDNPPSFIRSLLFHPSKYSGILSTALAQTSKRTSEPHQPSNGPPDSPLAPTLALLTLDQPTDRNP